jgi:hypothetical protein
VVDVHAAGYDRRDVALLGAEDLESDVLEDDRDGKGRDERHHLEVDRASTPNERLHREELGRRSEQERGDKGEEDGEHGVPVSDDEDTPGDEATDHHH